MPDKAPKTEQIMIRVDPEQKACLELAAYRTGDTLSNWMRRICLEAAGWTYVNATNVSHQHDDRLTRSRN